MMGRRETPVRVSGWLVITSLALVSCARVNETADRSAHGLQELGDVSWYDPATDQKRPANVAPPDLIPAPREWTVLTGEVESESSEWSALGVVKWLLMGILLGVFVAMLVVIVREFLRRWQERRPDAIVEVGAPLDVRMLDLPMSLGPVDLESDMLEEAGKCYASGDLGRALTLYYSYLLLELDRVGWIRISRGKTNRMYLSELKSRPQAYELLLQTCRLFEGFFFGKHLPPEADFAECWQQQETFRKWIADDAP